MFTIVFGLVVTAFIYAALGLQFKGGDLIYKHRPKQYLAFLAFALIWGINSFISVPANSVGIVFNQFSGVRDDVMQEGFNFKTPFDKVYIISTEVRTKQVAGVSGQTKDAQWISITMDIKYRVSKANAFEVFKQFKTLDNVDSTLLSPLVQRAIESVTTRYNIIDILGEQRNAVYVEIENAVKEKLSESGIEFFSLVLTDTDAGAAIEGAIEKQAVAKKDTETATEIQRRAEIEAQTKVLQSEAAAKVKLIEAQAESDANRLLTKSITPEILQQMEMEARIKWGWVTIQGAGSLIVDANK